MICNLGLAVLSKFVIQIDMYLLLNIIAQRQYVGTCVINQLAGIENPDKYSQYYSSIQMMNTCMHLNLI